MEKSTSGVWYWMQRQPAQMPDFLPKMWTWQQERGCPQSEHASWTQTLPCPWHQAETQVESCPCPRTSLRSNWPVVIMGPAEPGSLEKCSQPLGRGPACALQPCRQFFPVLEDLAQRSLPAPAQIPKPLHGCPPAPHPGKSNYMTSYTKKQEQIRRFREEPMGH